MKIKIYASYNKLTCELHNQTFMAPNDEVAKNIIENSMFDKDGKPDANSIRNAKNYKLCHLGEYDTEYGISGLGADFRIVCEFEELVTKNEKTMKNE